MFKRAAAVMALMFLCAGTARAAIAFDAATTISGSASSFNWTHEVTAVGDNTILIVTLGIQSDDATTPVTAVSYDGVALTLARREFVTFQIVEEIWYLVNPSTGANTVLVELLDSHKMVCSATSLTGVHQSDPVPTTAGNAVSAAASGPVTVAITTAYDDSWLVDGMYIGSADPVTAASGQTLRWRDNTTGASDAGNSSGGGGTEDIASAGANDVIWNWGVNKKWCMVVVEVREAPPPTATATPTTTATWTPTHTETATRTITLTATETATPTMTLTSTETNTPTWTATHTKTSTKTWTNTATETWTSTHTATHTPTWTSTSTETATPTATTTATPTVTATATPTPRYQDYNRLYWRGAVSAGGGGLAAGTVALLSMENDVVDTAGTYTWTNLNACSFSGAIFAEGSYSVYVPNANQCVHSDANITESITTAEMYLYTIPGASTTGRFYSVSSGISPFMQYDGVGNALRVYSGGWSASYSFPAINTWYHITLIMDDGAGGSEIYVDNVLRRTTAGTSVATNTTHHVGNYNTHINGCGAYVDWIRLSDIAQPGPYPTTD